MRAILFGASGLVGQSLLNDCLNNPSIEELTVILRRDVTLPESKKLKKVINPLTEIESLRVHLDMDICFCCLGSTIKKAGSKEAFKKVDYDLPLKIAELFKAVVPQGTFAVITARGADKDSAIFYNKVKGELEEDLKVLQLKHLIIARPSLIIGERQESRPMEFISQKLFNLIDPIIKMISPGVRGIPASVISNALLKKSLAPVGAIEIYESDKLWSLY